MPTFDEVVTQALAGSAASALTPVVEKEILHHEIIRCLADAGLLNQLTFIGGTCLRACYGSPRLSEDLDFTCGATFDSQDLAHVGKIVHKGVYETYGLEVRVSEPKTDTAATTGGNVRTWKMQFITNSGSNHLPQQRIHLDVCAVDSHERQATVLRNHYQVDLGTSGLIIQAQSMHEILADKMVALAMRPNRVKHRDLWDIAWLTQHGHTVDVDLVRTKCADRSILLSDYQHHLTQRLNQFPDLEREYRSEMKRFLPAEQIQRSLDAAGYWPYLVSTVTNCAEPLLTAPEN